jgi:hypothetical protein
LSSPHRRLLNSPGDCVARPAGVRSGRCERCAGVSFVAHPMEPNVI